MSEKIKKKVTPYIRTEQKRRSIEPPNVRETMLHSESPKIHNNEIPIQDNTPSFGHKEQSVSVGLKRKASTSALIEAKRKKSTEDKGLKEESLETEDPKEKVKNLLLKVDRLKAECMWKDSQLEQLKAELDEKVEEIKKLIATNSRYKSGLACIICTGYLANPCTVNCGHSFCYSCLREWLGTKRENVPKCPSCRAEVTTDPVLSYVLKDQVESLVEQLPTEEKQGVLEILQKEDQVYKQTSDHWAGIFDRSVRPLLDEEDGVLRCPTCGWEVEGPTCGNCGQRIGIESNDNESDDNNDSNDGDNSDIDSESNTYDSNDSFINDDGSDAENLTNDRNVITDENSSIVIRVNESYNTEDDGDSPSSNNDDDDPPYTNGTITINDGSVESDKEQNESYCMSFSSEDYEKRSPHSFYSNESRSTTPLSCEENYEGDHPCESDDEPFRVRSRAKKG
ncbi:19123_t:CDS:2 [Funneliformis geosporum]|uniref:9629_t:CDS:1 n=1 Tax=Funneliformis geosporum TaxID=1117311 RepID=A0A9W4SGB1_9GLOM|nr:9629_t:CDS:2 [Funneliformis geosporum]CAI2171664.1 19123_t:CDS:2 [Funneliformis geosporum]